MREILLSAQLQDGAVAWTARAVCDGVAEYGTKPDTPDTPETAIDALVLLAQELYTRVHDLEARLMEHYGS